jgi:multidrug resistance efflux pump
MNRAMLVLPLLLLTASRLSATSPTGIVDVTEREVTLTCTSTGSIEAPTQAKVATVVSGEIVHLKLEEGDSVKAGEIIAKLDTAALDAEVEAVQASIQVADANLARIRGGARPQEMADARAVVARAKAALDERQQELDRYQQLYDRQSATLKELQAMQAQFKMAQQEHERALQREALVGEGARSDDIDIARRKLDEARSQLKGLQTRRDKTVIKAPIDGIVVKKLAYLGEVALPGQPLVHLVSLARLDAVLNVEETYIDGIQVGDTGEVSVDAIPGKTFPGKVTFISPVSSEQLKMSLLKEEEDTKRFHVKIRVEAGAARLRAGMSVKGKFTIGRKGIFVPREAVGMKAGLNFVKLQSGSRVVEKTVRTGVRQGPLIQITDGLIGGEKLVVSTESSSGGLLTTP